VLYRNISVMKSRKQIVLKQDIVWHFGNLMS